jgi:hypothetical protein
MAGYKFATGCKIGNMPVMPAAKPVRLKQPLHFDEAMRRLVKLPPLPSGKKAQRKVWRKKQRKN